MENKSLHFETGHPQEVPSLPADLRRSRASLQSEFLGPASSPLLLPGRSPSKQKDARSRGTSNFPWRPPPPEAKTRAALPAPQASRSGRSPRTRSATLGLRRWICSNGYTPCNNNNNNNNKTLHSPSVVVEERLVVYAGRPSFATCCRCGISIHERASAQPTKVDGA